MGIGDLGCSSLKTCLPPTIMPITNMMDPTVVQRQQIVSKQALEVDQNCSIIMLKVYKGDSNPVLANQK